MRKKTIKILKDAMEGGYAVGAFNTTTMELTQGIIRAANELEKPCIIQMTANAMSYANDKVLGGLIQSVIREEADSTQVGFHLDHGKSFDDIVRAIDAGVDSVMIDASKASFEENCKISKKVVDYAHGKDVTVQAELGAVPYTGREDEEIDWEQIMTDPEQAKELVEYSGVDAFAVGIGNAHGSFPERPEPDWERLRKIRSLIPEIPLIMHGASDWEQENVKQAIKEGIACFNIDTSIRLSFLGAIREVLADQTVTDPRKVLGGARESVTKKVKEKIEMFNSL